MSDTRRDVAERLAAMSLHPMALFDTDWPEVRRTLLEAAALLREPSEGREPEDERLRWLERTGTEAITLLDRMRHLGEEVGEWMAERNSDHEAHFGTPSDSPAGEG